MILSPNRAVPCLIALALVFGLCPATRADDPKKLSSDDKAFLDGLFKDFLFDPVGAQYVSVKVTQRTVWAKEEQADAEGWLKTAPPARQARIYFADGESVPAPKPEQIKNLDFVAAYRAGARGDIVTAAWLHRLGHNDLAAECLARLTRPKEKELSQTRNQLAWSAFADMVHAYMVRADEEALQHGEHLLRLYPKEAEKYPQSKDIVADLKRRQQKGTFGKTPPKEWSAGFDKWEPKKKVAYLIDALDEVDARQWGQPGGVDLARDRRVSALIGLGEVAVPDLIDTVENDRRLTRSVHFFRDFARSRTVMAVREAALVAAMSIMQVQAFESQATGDDFTARGNAEAAKVAARLRDYWKKYAGVPFDERMMKILTDAKSDPKAMREAAENLARGAERRPRGTTMTFQMPGAQRGPNPAIAKFKNPTAAEAILAALDRDLAAFESAKSEPPAAGNRDRRQLMQMQIMAMGRGGSVRDFERQQIEDSYLRALAVLNDKRIASALVKRVDKAASPRMRRRLAILCQEFAEPAPFKAFAEDFRQGKIKLPPDKRSETGFGPSAAAAELMAMVGDLISVGTPEADKALMALAEPDQPYHERAELAVLNANVRGWGDNVWFKHPVSLLLLRDALTDKTPTGATYHAEGDRLKREDERGGMSTGPLSDVLQEGVEHKNSAPERICDLAAEKITQLTFGVPTYHALLKDADVRLKELKQTLDRYTFRLATPGENETLGEDSFQSSHFVVDMPPLDRPATAEDVKKGKAIFHLDGKAKLADPKPPLIASQKNKPIEKEPGRPRRGFGTKQGDVLIVQAEVGADGKTTYGVITMHGMRKLSADDVKDVKPLPVYYIQTFGVR